MEEHPPIWLIAVLALQAMLALAGFAVGVTLIASPNGVGRIAVPQILVMSAPLVIVLGIGSLAWWLWMAGWRKLGGLVAFAPLFPILLAIVVFGALM